MSAAHDKSSLPPAFCATVARTEWGYALVRKRYQRGQLIRQSDRWLGRWREDIVLADGSTKRVNRKQILGSIAELPTRKLALRAMEDRLHEINASDYRPLRAGTFGQFAEQWQRDVMCNHKAASQSGERSCIRKHLVPIFGKLPLTQITTPLIQNYVSVKLAGYRANSIHTIINIFKTMWKTAKAWDYAKHDPFKGLKLPTIEDANVHFFTPEEAIAVIDRAAEPYKTFFITEGATGMRPGELAGLRVEDIDFAKLEIRIKQSLFNREVQTPKTKNARRPIPISEGLAARLRAFLKAAKPNVHGLVFADDKGRPISTGSIRKVVLEPILVELGIRQKIGEKRCGFYAFRHMAGSLMDTWGVPLKARQELMGHSDPSITLRHYTEPMDPDKRAFADRVWAVLDPETPEAIQ